MNEYVFNIGLASMQKHFHKKVKKKKINSTEFDSVLFSPGF